MGLDLYPSIVVEGDLSPGSFGSEVDEICNEIHNACAGFGTNERKLLQAMGSQNPETRCKVSLRYQELFGKALQDVVRKECGSRDFGLALQYMAVPSDEAECYMIREACKGLGTNEFLIATIICGRSNREMEILKKKYFSLFTKDLGRVLDGELGGSYESLIFNCLQADEQAYDPEYHNDEKMEEDVKHIYKMGQGKTFGTNEAGMFKILCAAPPEYLKKMNLLYAEKYGYTLSKALELEMGSQLEQAAKFMLGMKLKPYEEIAKLIDRACRGVGTNELLLSCTLIRYQNVLKDVMVAFIELYGEAVADRVKSEVRGDYKALLLEILEAADQN